MSSNECEILLHSSGRRLTAEKGQTLLFALFRNGIHLRSDCGAKGTCGKCMVRIISPNAHENGRNNQPGSTETDTGSRDTAACQVTLDGDISIEIPVASLASPEVVSKPAFSGKLEPLSPTSGIQADRGKYGLAIDLGTTTVAIFLCDLSRKRVLGSGTIRNPQIVFGDDVMSRISAVSMDPLNVSRQQNFVVEGINETIVYLAGRQGIDPGEISRVVTVGNSTMIHLFLGVDPSPIGRYPYETVFSELREVAASDIGLMLNPEAAVTTLPLISGFLGSDIISAAAAGGLDRAREPVIVVDVDTNGDIMINAGGKIVATSCATGPALEGANIRHGIHAVSGAIDSVNLGAGNQKPVYSMIQNNPEKPKKAAGICGSGIVSAVAELVKSGIVTGSGRFNLESPYSGLRFTDGGAGEFVIVPGDETQSGVDIVLTQKDIRAVQLAKGALITGIQLLCLETGIDTPHRLLVAGAFGSFMDKEDAISIGMFPRLNGMPIETIGNAAGEGAVLALLDDEFKARVFDIAERADILDLGAHPDFQKVFMDSMAFPDI